MSEANQTTLRDTLVRYNTKPTIAGLDDAVLYEDSFSKNDLNFSIV